MRIKRAMGVSEYVVKYLRYEKIYIFHVIWLKMFLEDDIVLTHNKNVFMKN